MRFTGSSDGDAAQSSLLPALFGVLLAIVFWMLADHLREQLQAVDQEIGTVQRTANRVSDSSELDGLQDRLEKVQTQKAAWTAKLKTTEPAQMIRAKIVYDLRQKCAATGATACSIRLADDTIASTAAEPTRGATPGNGASEAAPADDGQLKLIDLGIQKARAIVSGSFQNDEIAQFSRRLQSDPDARWRINGVVVRGTTFEFDVERHIITGPPGS